MPRTIVVDDRVWCPLCQEYAQLLKISKAAKLADVTERTIYRYIEEGRVHTIKVAGKTYRVCAGCLLKQDATER